MNRQEEYDMKYYCNPININYRYQFNADQRNQGLQIAREAADPSMIFFDGKYFIFASMQLSVWMSEDLVNWKSHRLPGHLPLYDYAPDVRVIGEYVYFCASKRGEVCNFYRTKDILNGPYEEIHGSFDFWDPNLFYDEDGRVYFYWGCSNAEPIWGVELDAKTLLPIGEKVPVVTGDPWRKGFERVGENHSKPPKSEAEVEIAFQHFMKQQSSGIPTEYLPLIKGMLSDKPYIEGAWMDKYKGKYYLQYAFAGTQYNIYGDGVMVGDSPLGPFTLAENNPYSYKPGGFIPGAGHGSTMWDKQGNLWHTSTMRISRNHQFERRVGLFPAGFDNEGELFCNQRYGDWPVAVPEGSIDPWEEPKWFLLSAGKCVESSSYIEGREPEYAVEEDVRTWWQSASHLPGEWIEVDLKKAYDIRGIQINFADDTISIPCPGKIRGTTQARYIEERDNVTRWKLEGSLDKKEYVILVDKSQTNTDLPHDFLVFEEGINYRYLKLTILSVPYQQRPCISGLRVFGIGDGSKPDTPEFKIERISDLDRKVIIQGEDAVGYNILWGSCPEKLYHSCMTFEKTNTIGALVKDREYYVRVDAFNESGITEGTVKKMD